MTIHAYTEPRGPLPAYINISERVSNPGDVVVTVRSNGENDASSIVLTRDQLELLAFDALKFVDSKQPPVDNAHVAPGCEQFSAADIAANAAPTAQKAIVCPRRGELGAGASVFKLPESDHIRADDTCSYCGSLDPDVLMARIEAGTIFLEGSDKNYKVYLKATEGSEPLKYGGADKFYFQHLSEPQKIRFIELYNERKVKHSLYVLPFFMARV